MTLDIIMPFYGRPDHLDLAVRSVLAQSDPDWRLVVIDDLYPDTRPGLQISTIDDPRVSYVRNEANLGVSRSFTLAAQTMTAEYGVIMGCDDVLLPRFVERVGELLRLFPGAEIVQPGVAVIDAEGARVDPLADRVKRRYRGRVDGPRRMSGETLATSLLRGNWAYFPSLVWRTETVSRVGFRPDLSVVQDLATILDIVLAGGDLVLDSEVVFEYRRHAASVSAVGGPDGSKFREERALFRVTAERLDDLGWTRGARIARQHLSSRLHAATDLPAALRAGESRATRTIVSHILGLPYPR